MSSSGAYTPTIGLEIHAQLKTRTKMFCDSKNDPEEKEPNVNVCPVCMAHPGTLPTINKAAVHHILRIGSAVGGTISDYTEFDRKSYFYPDIPKGFQISQYEHPLVKGGTLNGVAITRVHLEEDTARSTHISGASLVDFNRAGTPLMELVTEPVIHDAKTAGDFARELQLLLRTLGAGDANLEKGEMRIEANISVSATDVPAKAYVEVKNINSFRAVERAIEYEIHRQTGVLESGGRVVKETRGWNEDKGETFSQRLKEGSADYRYFPEPDLPKLVLSELSEWKDEALSTSLPELPWERRTRYASLGLKVEDIAYLSATFERSLFFDAVCALLHNDARLVTLVTNYITSDLAGLYAKNNKKEFENISPEQFVSVMQMITANEISSRGAKEILSVLVERGGDPKTIKKEKGLGQMNDTDALKTAVASVIAEHQSVVADYQKGKESALEYLVGQVMKATKGAGNPNVVRDLLVKTLKKERK